MKRFLLKGLLPIALFGASAHATEASQPVMTITCPAHIQVKTPAAQVDAPEGFVTLTQPTKLTLYSANIYSSPLEQLAVLKPERERISKRVFVDRYELIPSLWPELDQFSVMCAYAEGLVVLSKPLPKHVKRCTSPDPKKGEDILFHCSP